MNFEKLDAREDGQDAGDDCSVTTEGSGGGGQTLRAEDSDNAEANLGDTANEGSDSKVYRGGVFQDEANAGVGTDNVLFRRATRVVGEAGMGGTGSAEVGAIARASRIITELGMEQGEFVVPLHSFRKDVNEDKEGAG